MSVNNTDRVATFYGGVANTEYTFNFPYNVVSDLKLKINGVISNYASVQPAASGSEGGYFVISTTVDQLSTDVITFYRETPLTQNQSFEPNTTPAAADVAAALDKLTMASQEQSEVLNRTAKSAIGTENDYVINSTIGLDADGNGVSRTVTEEIAHLGITDGAAEAAVSAAEAEISNLSANAAVEILRTPISATNVFIFNDVSDVGTVNVSINGIAITEIPAGQTPAAAAVLLRDFINFLSGSMLVTAAIEATSKVVVTAVTLGSAGNGITCTDTSANGSWSSVSTTGGYDGGVTNTDVAGTVYVPAAGNGTTDDDTSKVQAALDLLEGGTINHLHFPSGVYRLVSKVTPTSPDSLPLTATANYAHLTLGTTAGLDGRDILITGDPGTVILSDTPPTRCHILSATARMRSLKFEGLRFEKTSALIWADVDEPNGCEGVSLIAYVYPGEAGAREVEHVTFQGCTFFNTHGACRTHRGLGNLMTGKLKRFIMNDCSVLNPYGPNTDINRLSPPVNTYGSGQQVNVESWVNICSITNSRFQGGADVLDATYNPEKSLKDAAFFGGPLRLIFTGNTVENFGIETVFQISDAHLLGYKLATPVTMPSDIVTTVQWTMREREHSTFPVGMIVVLERTNGSGGYEPMQFKVTAYDSVSRVVTATATAHASNAAAGSVSTGNRIWVDEASRQFATVTGNTFTHSTPTGVIENNSGQAVFLDSPGVVSNNTISGFGSAVSTYEEKRLLDNDQCERLVVSNNIITIVDRTLFDTAHTGSVSAGNYNNGIYLRSNKCRIFGNTINTETSRKQFGIRTSGNDTLIYDNNVFTLQSTPTNTGSDRGIGITELLASTGNIFRDNSTSGWDFGICPTTFSGAPNGIIQSHTSGDVIKFYTNYNNTPDAGFLAGFDVNGRVVPLGNYETLVAVTTADENRNTDSFAADTAAAVASSTQLRLPLRANSSYSLKLWLNYHFVTGGADNGIKFKFHIEDAPYGLRGSYSIYVNGSAVATKENKRFYNTGTTTGTMSHTAGHATEAIIMADGSIRTGLTDGILVLDWAKNSVGTTADITRIKSGAVLTATRQSSS
jgi:hypothetical protein|tara:strand:- start:1164 stop:4388 length:3225 start_codon:yes stop_codon:yes gene_type:complete